MGYEVIYRWRHTHPFIESIKVVNITEPHDQLLFDLSVHDAFKSIHRFDTHSVLLTTFSYV